MNSETSPVTPLQAEMQKPDSVHFAANGDEAKSLQPLLDALKPCPHCGLTSPVRIDVRVADGDNVYAARCENLGSQFSEQGCGATSGEHWSEAEAIAAWNRRALPLEVLYALRQASGYITHCGHGDNCFVSNHYDGDPGNRCNCGKDSLGDVLHETLMRFDAEYRDDALGNRTPARQEEPKCPRCGLPQAECDFQKNFPDPDPDGVTESAAPLPVQGQEAEDLNEQFGNVFESLIVAGFDPADAKVAALVVAALRASSAPTTKG